MRRWCFWETASTEADEPAVFWDYAGIWRATEKILYSRTLQTVSSARTPIEREFDRDALRRSSSPRGRHRNRGAELAGHAIGAGLVDECHLFLCPIVVGRGKRALPDTSARNSNFSMNAGSETASFTSTTA
jgi:dihydrofolate reductase